MNRGAYLTRLIAIAALFTGNLGLTAASADAQGRPQSEAPRFRTLTVGQHFSCGLTYDGEAFCWGANYYGQLGVRAAPGIASCGEDAGLVSTCALLPVRVAAPQRFTDLTAGLKHVCAVSADRTVWCWGRNDADQLGASAPTTCSPRASARGLEEYVSSPCSFEPIRVDGLPPARLVAAGDDFSCALSADEGAISCWGGSAGARPRRVSGSERFMTVAAGYTSVCGDADDSRVACWSLYNGISETKWATSTEGLHGVATSNHTCAIAETNHAYCWGFNAGGSLGYGHHAPREVADMPTPVAGNRKFVKIAVSFLGTCAVDASHGELFCWGSAPGTPQPDRCASGSEFGGSTRCALTPQPVFPRWNFGSVAIAVAHGCGIAATANAYCWGANDFGQLGNGTTDDATELPQLVGVQGRGGGSRKRSAPSPRIMVLVGIVTLLALLVVRVLRSRTA